ncbi:hypothetical protein HDV05_005436 [Chytridiales sp. JEL 0842]|nr:hypothetical protein HDV05_005436 [Chytridiales sp. JEL 0842]
MLVASIQLPQLVGDLPSPGQDTELAPHHPSSTSHSTNTPVEAPLKKLKMDSSSESTKPASPPQQQQYIHLALYNSVSNAAQLKKLIIAGDPSIPECVMVNPKMVMDPFQVQMACTRALLNQTQGKLKTRTLLSEILYSFSPSTNISEAMKLFGVSDKMKAILVVVLGGKEVPSESFEKLERAIKGSIVPIEDLEKLTDWEGMQKVYKFNENPTTELSKEDILSVVVGSIALKGYA